MIPLFKKVKVLWIKFKLLFHKEPYGISDGRIVYLNKAAQELFKKAN
jgi:hypothetical protein